MGSSKQGLAANRCPPSENALEGFLLVMRGRHRGPGDACRHLTLGIKNIYRPIPRSSSRAPAIFTRGQRPREDSLGFEKDKSAVALKFNFSKSGEHLVKYQLKPRRMKTDLEILGLHA